ncbi:hypothetical protein B0I37DRAFT_372893 [Chaetomium sp. MPI-CAGE-AT-0009]|nr:hypothetical protein B0I37DRAFT_372893 [Chaetomium sp. MPI-CAGE-AT-0009]
MVIMVLLISLSFGWELEFGFRKMLHLSRDQSASVFTVPCASSGKFREPVVGELCNLRQAAYWINFHLGGSQVFPVPCRVSDILRPPASDRFSPV